MAVRCLQLGMSLRLFTVPSVPTVSDRTWLQALTLAVPLCKKRGFRATVLMLAGASYSSTRFLTTQFIRWTRTGLSKAGIPVPSESRAIKPSRLSASIFHDSSLPRIAQGDYLIKSWRSARSCGRHEAEGWRVRKDGTRFWANAIIRPILDEQRALVGFAKITRDITERVQAQQAIIETERRFRILVEGVFDYAIYMLDPSGIITNWNTGAERLKGYSAEEIVGRHFSRFYMKEDREAGLTNSRSRRSRERWCVTRRRDGASVRTEAVLGNGRRRCNSRRGRRFGWFRKSHTRHY